MARYLQGQKKGRPLVRKKPYQKVVRTPRDMPRLLTFMDSEQLLRLAGIMRDIACEDLMCVRCASEKRHVHRSTVLRAIERGSIAAYTLCCGRMGYFVDSHDIEKLVPEDLRFTVLSRYKRSKVDRPPQDKAPRRRPTVDQSK